MKSHCINGHRLTESNIKYYYPAAYPGKIYRRCKMCISAAFKLRYDNDEAYRERRRAQKKARIAKLRQEREKANGIRC